MFYSNSSFAGKCINRGPHDQSSNKLNKKKCCYLIKKNIQFAHKIFICVQLAHFRCGINMCHFKLRYVLTWNSEPFVQLEVTILHYSGSFLLVSVATQSKRSAMAVTDLIRGTAFSHKPRALINEQKHEAMEHHTN